MDLTYKSYEKWKDSSKIVDSKNRIINQSRFHNFDNYEENQMNFWQINQGRANVGGT